MLNFKMFYNVLIKKRILYYLIKSGNISNTNVVRKFNLNKQLTRFFKKNKIKKKKKFNKNLVFYKSKKNLTQNKNEIKINNYKFYNNCKKLILRKNIKYCGFFFKKKLNYNIIFDNKKENFIIHKSVNVDIDLKIIPQIFFI